MDPYPHRHSFSASTSRPSRPVHHSSWESIPSLNRQQQQQHKQQQNIEHNKSYLVASQTASSSSPPTTTSTRHPLDRTVDAGSTTSSNAPTSQSSRQDRAQPIIIQNFELLKRSQLTLKRKALSTANLYLSQASLHRHATNPTTTTTNNNSTIPPSTTTPPQSSGIPGATPSNNNMPHQYPTSINSNNKIPENRSKSASSILSHNTIRPFSTVNNSQQSNPPSNNSSNYSRNRTSSAWQQTTNPSDFPTDHSHNYPHHNHHHHQHHPYDQSHRQHSNASTATKTSTLSTSSSFSTSSSSPHKTNKQKRVTFSASNTFHRYEPKPEEHWGNNYHHHQHLNSRGCDIHNAWYRQQQNFIYPDSSKTDFSAVSKRHHNGIGGSDVTERNNNNKINNILKSNGSYVNIPIGMLLDKYNFGQGVKNSHALLSYARGESVDGDDDDYYNDEDNDSEYYNNYNNDEVFEDEVDNNEEGMSNDPNNENQHHPHHPHHQHNHNLHQPRPHTVPNNITSATSINNSSLVTTTNINTTTPTASPLDITDDHSSSISSSGFSTYWVNNSGPPDSNDPQGSSSHFGHPSDNVHHHHTSDNHHNGHSTVTCGPISTDRVANKSSMNGSSHDAIIDGNNESRDCNDIPRDSTRFEDHDNKGGGYANHHGKNDYDDDVSTIITHQDLGNNEESSPALLSAQDNRNDDNNIRNKIIGNTLPQQQQQQQQQRQQPQQNHIPVSTFYDAFQEYAIIESSTKKSTTTGRFNKSPNNILLQSKQTTPPSHDSFPPTNFRSKNKTTNGNKLTNSQTKTNSDGKHQNNNNNSIVSQKVIRLNFLKDSDQKSSQNNSNNSQDFIVVNTPNSTTTENDVQVDNVNKSKTDDNISITGLQLRSDNNAVLKTNNNNNNHNVKTTHLNNNSCSNINRTSSSLPRPSGILQHKNGRPVSQGDINAQFLMNFYSSSGERKNADDANSDDTLSTSTIRFDESVNDDNNHDNNDGNASFRSNGQNKVKRVTFEPGLGQGYYGTFDRDPVNRSVRGREMERKLFSRSRGRDYPMGANRTRSASASAANFMVSGNGLMVNRGDNHKDPNNPMSGKERLHSAERFLLKNGGGEPQLAGRTSLNRRLEELVVSRSLSSRVKLAIDRAKSNIS